ncbi:hypothetical protein MMC25_002810 [Agyrium rufum]|nr:hypothetical protein [Agyrium rufum]
MKGKRSKQYRKLMQQYALTFGFREPYQVLVDAQMIRDSVTIKMDLIAGLQRTLQGQVKPMITQCSIRHLYTIPVDVPKQHKDACIELAKQFERRRCNHHLLEEPLSTLACFKDVIDAKGSGTNKNRYTVACQEDGVRAWCRTVHGVPLIYVKRSVMVMEPMAEASTSVRDGVEKSKLRAGIKSQDTKRKRTADDEERAGQGVAAADRIQGEEPDSSKKRKTKGPKGPNPLSVRKPKPRPERAESLLLEQKEDEEGHVVETEAVSGDAVTTGADPESSASKTKTKRRRRHKPTAAVDID